MSGSLGWPWFMTPSSRSSQVNGRTIAREADTRACRRLPGRRQKMESVPRKLDGYFGERKTGPNCGVRGLPTITKGGSRSQRPTQPPGIIELDGVSGAMLTVSTMETIADERRIYQDLTNELHPQATRKTVNRGDVDQSVETPVGLQKSTAVPPCIKRIQLPNIPRMPRAPRR